MKKKILIITLLAAAMLTTFAKGAEQKPADGVFTPNQGTETIAEETMKMEVESEIDDHTVKINISPELKAEAEEYASYVEMQEDKIGLLSRKLMECASYSEYVAIAEQILTIANDLRTTQFRKTMQSLRA